MGTVRDERIGFVRTLSNHSNRKFYLTYALFQMAMQYIVDIPSEEGNLLCDDSTLLSITT